MKTTDKDIQVLEEMRGIKQMEAEMAKDPNANCGSVNLEFAEEAQRDAVALSNILSDFRDMREMLEAAKVGLTEGLRHFEHTDCYLRPVLNEGANGCHTCITIGHLRRALDAWRKVKRGK